MNRYSGFIQILLLGLGIVVIIGSYLFLINNKFLNMYFNQTQSGPNTESSETETTVQKDPYDEKTRQCVEQLKSEIAEHNVKYSNGVIILFQDNVNETKITEVLESYGLPVMRKYESINGVAVNVPRDEVLFWKCNLMKDSTIKSVDLNTISSPN